MGKGGGLFFKKSFFIIKNQTVILTFHRTIIFPFLKILKKRINLISRSLINCFYLITLIKLNFIIPFFIKKIQKI